jgi:regulator of sigma E protease
MSELRWRIVQAALEGERLRLIAGEEGARSGRTVTLELDRVDRHSIDSGFIEGAVGLGAPFGPAVIGDVVPGGPADRAGLKSGDRVLRVDEQPIADSAQLRRRIRALDGEGRAAAMHWTIERGTRVLDLPVQPRVLVEGAQRLGRIDAVVGTPPAMTTVNYGPLEGLARGASMTWEQSLLTVRMLGRMVTGQASLRNLTGPVTIADYAGRALERGLFYYVGLLAAVSVGLGVLNLMPVPLLDGGHLMYYLFEGLTGRPVPDAWLVWLQRGGALVLAMLMTLALYNDLAPRLGLH